MEPIDDDDQAGFRERLMALIDWVSERDPTAAARLMADYAADLVAELASTPDPTSAANA